MASPTSQELLKCCCCFNIRTSMVALAFYHMAMSVLFLIEHALEVANGKGYCKITSNSYYKIADIASGFLLIILLFLISATLLYGVMKNRERHFIPFMALQTMDIFLSTLTLCSFYMHVPIFVKFTSSKPLTRRLWSPFLALQVLDFCLILLTLCSSYMEIPPFLNFQSMNHMNYFPNEKMLASESTKILVFLTLLFLVVLAFKVHMLRCVWRCFKYIKVSKKAMVKVAPDICDPEKIVLPSYEEAMKLPSKEPPPPYVAV
ncbi:lysosomal-associated transmembrane protein 5 [Microcaecilia unicolor]|uniref:Lysosomal-associated transmembrane protein 5 n=1 Tax=Microcaecilia unicolor TaxID=1415580 RepID=A0A6P7ZLD3_9AMPH|nr:lysosomal-associated transmembrane protein 5 [Microcaecilia unicolor]